MHPTFLVVDGARGYAPHPPALLIQHHAAQTATDDVFLCNVESGLEIVGLVVIAARDQKLLWLVRGFYLALGIAKADHMGSLGENLPLVGIEIDRSPVCRCASVFFASFKTR